MATNECAWLDARITKTEKLIESIEAAIDAIGSGAQSYTLDTGQSRQVVTKANVASLKTLLDSLENRRVMLKQRRYGGGSLIGRGL
jgi:hypothetical protein